LVSRKYFLQRQQNHGENKNNLVKSR